MSETFDFSEAWKRLTAGRKVRRECWCESLYWQIETINTNSPRERQVVMHYNDPEWDSCPDWVEVEELLATDWQEVTE